LPFDRSYNDEPCLGSDALIEIGAETPAGRRVRYAAADPAGACEWCKGEELDIPATMTLSKAFNDFMRSSPARPFVLPIRADQVAPHMLRYEVHKIELI
jgi:hypothetical protein